MPPLWLIKAAGILALLAVAWFHGHGRGAASVQAKWDKQAQDDRDAAETLRESDRLRAQTAATTYEAQRTAIAARLNKPQPEATYALHATICPPAGALGRPLELGDVPISGAVLDRLRDSGADYTGH